MEEYGAITIVCHPHSTVSSTYTISDIDGRVCVNKWNEFMKKEKNLDVRTEGADVAVPGRSWDLSVCFPCS